LANGNLLCFNLNFNSGFVNVSVGLYTERWLFDDPNGYLINMFGYRALIVIIKHLYILVYCCRTYVLHFAYFNLVFYAFPRDVGDGNCFSIIICIDLDCNNLCN